MNINDVVGTELTEFLTIKFRVGILIIISSNNQSMEGNHTKFDDVIADHIVEVLGQMASFSNHQCTMDLLCCYLQQAMHCH